MAKKTKGERAKYGPGQFAQLQHSVTSCANYKKLSMDARAMMQDANAMINGKNNGDLCLSFKSMKLKGWNNKRRLFNARHELEHYGFIEVTKQGGSHRPTLYALAWISVQRCNGRHDACPTCEPSMAYLQERDQWIRRKQKPPTAVREKTVQPETLELPNNRVISLCENRNSGSPQIPKRFTPDASAVKK